MTIWCNHGGFSSRSCDVGALVRCTDTVSGPTQPGGQRQGKCNVWNTYIAVHTKKNTGSKSLHSCWLDAVWKSLKIVQMKCIPLCVNAGIWLVWTLAWLWATVLYYKNITSHHRLLFCTKLKHVNQKSRIYHNYGCYYFRILKRDRHLKIFLAGSVHLLCMYELVWWTVVHVVLTVFRAC